MKVFLLALSLTLFFNFSAEAHPALPTLKDGLQTIMQKWVQEFQIPVVLRFDEASPAVASCIPHSRGSAIFLCDSVLNAMLDFNSEADATAAANLILFHELSHFLIVTRTDTREIIPSVQTLDQLVSEMPKSFSFSSLIRNLQHDNIDGIAAKIMHDFGYALPADLEAFDITNLMDLSGLTEKELTQLAITQPMRIQNIKRAFDEGWDSWKDYLSVFTPCAQNPSDPSETFNYLKRKLKDSSNIGTKACSTFPDSAIQSTLVQYVRTLKKFEQK